MAGPGRVRPWDPAIDVEPEYTEPEDNPKENETPEYIRAVIKCANVVDEMGGMVKLTNSKEDRGLLLNFQRDVFEQALGTPDPVFDKAEEGVPDEALPVKRVRPDQKTKCLKYGRMPFVY